MGEITNDQFIKSILKTWYKDGVENLMFRNSPVLRKLTKVRVEGKEQNFSAMYGRGGAVSANFITAKANAKVTSRNAEFSVTPGKLFSVYSMNAKEIQSSVSKRGAYMRVAGNKMFASSECMRKTMALCLYGRGYGEICLLPTAVASTIQTGTGTDVTLPSDAIMKIDVGSELEIKETISSASARGTATVSKINGNVVTLVAKSAPISSVTAGDVLCLSGSMDSAGNPALPMGLDGWLPTVNNRTSTQWDQYVNTPFFGVKRNICAERLCGSFVLGAKSESVNDTLQALLMRCRRLGSQADMIVLNDEDFLELSKEIQTDNTYYTQTSTKESRKANFGIAEFSASFSTNYIENIIDDPYCPKGKAYILDSTAVELWSYTNADEVTDDGIAGNNPGKADPMTDDDKGQEDTSAKLIIDDYINVEPGDGDSDGPNMEVSLMFFGSVVVTNPSVCGVCIFDANKTYIGYSA